MDPFNFSVESELHESSLSGEFRYGGQALESHEIRILWLLPDEAEGGESVISCHLVRFDLRAAKTLHRKRQPFVALSYTWGNPEPPQRILVNGRWKEISPNLHEALLHIRDQFAPIPLWIDSVCINQSSKQERNAEVTKMARIYGDCWTVLYWLGPIDDDHPHLVPNDMAARALVEVESIYHKLCDRDAEKIDNPWQAWKEISLADRHTATLEIQDHLFALFTLPFWQRVWITQEVVLAQDGFFMWGPHVFNMQVLEALYSVRHEFTALPHIDHFGSVATGPRAFTTGLGAISMRHRNTNLLEALVKVRRRLAGDAHDYIYGMMGIARLENSAINPDYEKPLESVFREALAVILEQENNLDVLSACNRGWAKCSIKDHDADLQDTEVRGHGEHDKGNDWPTWLPDWSFSELKSVSSRGNPNIRSLLYDSLEFRPVTFNACAGTKKDVEILPGGKHLRCRGISFDSVVEIIGNEKSEWPKHVKQLWDEGHLDRVYPSWKHLRAACVATSLYGDDTYVPSPGNLFEGVEEPIEAEQSTAAGARGTQPFDEEKPFFMSDDRKLSTRAWHAVTVGNCESWYFQTRRGYIGRSPMTPAIGDCLSILSGGKVPFLLRKQEYSDSFQMAGEAYVHGIMQGGVVHTEGNTWEDFILV